MTIENFKKGYFESLSPEIIGNISTATDQKLLHAFEIVEGTEMFKNGKMTQESFNTEVVSVLLHIDSRISEPFRLCQEMLDSPPPVEREAKELSLLVILLGLIEPRK